MFRSVVLERPFRDRLMALVTLTVICRHRQSSMGSSQAAAAVKADLDMARDDPQATAQVREKAKSIPIFDEPQAYMEAVLAKANVRRAAQSSWLPGTNAADGWPK